MKKFALVFMLGLVCLTGCGKKGNEVICTGSVNEDGQKVSMKVTGTLKDNKINAVKAVMTFDKKETAEQMCSLFELANTMADDDSKKIDVKCDGKKVIFNDYAALVASDDDAKIIGVSKDEFVKTMETQDLKCK